MTILYRILLGVTGLALAGLLLFFMMGFGDGTVDVSNMLLWLVLLALPAGALVGAMHFWKAGSRKAAIMLLAVPATPALLYGLFIALFVILQPDMR